jgi:signal transduction histidine kinase/CheY-like chemotaxis protein
LSQTLHDADVARREAADEASHERTSRVTDLETFLQVTPNLVCAVRGAEHVIEFASDAVLALVGARRIVGRPLREALPELANSAVLAALGTVREKGEAFRQREVIAWFRAEDGKGTPHYLDIVGKPVSRSGDQDLIALFAQDVTELVMARQAAESASRVKDEFLAMLGHELRNPLAPIRTALELLRARDDAPMRLELRVIERQVEHLVGLVDDLLDISRISQGRIELRRETVDLADAIGSAIEMVAPLMQKREHQVTVDVPRRTLWVDGDRARLTQIFTNLLTNSAKFCEPRGQVWVHASVAEDGAIVARVKDDGAGIEPELLPRVFHLFEQGRHTLDRAMGGLGLGLGIVRSLVLLHGGQVRVESGGVGQGAEFMVILPMTGEPTERMVRPAGISLGERNGDNHSGPRLRVLVVDDNDDAAELIAVALATKGHETATASDGPSALEAVTWFKPHVAVLDIGLPAMDGFELGRRIRELPELGAVRLIAVTGYGQDSDRQRSRAAGFDAHLLKPIQISELYDAIHGRVSSRRARDHDGHKRSERA